jgi:hypothetical protein
MEFIYTIEDYEFDYNRDETWYEGYTDNSETPSVTVPEGCPF